MEIRTKPRVSLHYQGEGAHTKRCGAAEAEPAESSQKGAH